MDAQTGRCRGGPVSLHAGDFDTIEKDVGVLSVGLTAKNVAYSASGEHGQFLNIQILVTDNSAPSCSSDVPLDLPSKLPCTYGEQHQNKLFVVVESRGHAFFASVAITHHAQHMLLREDVLMSLHLSNSGLQHYFRALGWKIGAIGSVVLSLTHDREFTLGFSDATLKLFFSVAASATAVMPTSSSSKAHGELSPTGGGIQCVAGGERAAMLGVLIVSSSPPTTNVKVIRSTLNITANIKDAKNLELSVLDRGQQTATVIMGIVVSAGSMSSSKTAVEISNSTINIAPMLMNTSNVSISAACVFGIIIESATVSSGWYQKNAVVDVRVDDTSTIAFVASIFSTTSSLSTTIGLFRGANTQAALGLAVSCAALGGQSKQNVLVTVQGALLISAFLSGNVTLFSAGHSIGHSSGLVAVLGVAVYGSSASKLNATKKVTMSLAAQHTSLIDVGGQRTAVLGIIAKTLSVPQIDINRCTDKTSRILVPHGVLMESNNPTKVNVHITNKTGTCASERLAVHQRQQDITSTASSVHCWVPIRRYPPYVTPSMTLMPSDTVSPTTTPAGFLPQKMWSVTRSLQETATPTSGITSSRSLSTSVNTISRSSSASASQSLVHHRLPQSRVFPQNVTTSPAPAVESVTRAQRTTVTVVSSTVLVTSAANSGGSGLQDVQALVVLGSMACASDEMQTISSGGEKSVVPFELPVLEEGSRSRTLLSNSIVLVGLGIIHLLVSMIIVLKKRKPFVEACGLARFPAWSFSAFVLLYQGTILTAFRAVFSPSTSTDRILGPVLVIFCFAVPLISPLLRLRGVWTATFVTYESAFARVPSILRIIVFPTGYYDGSPDVDPDGVVRRFGTLFTSVAEHTHPFFTTLGFVKAFLIALVATLPPDAIGCPTRFSLVGVLSFIMAVLVILRRPWRVSLNNILSGLSNLCTAALCFASTKPEVVGSQVSSIITATVGLGMITSVGGIIMKLLEVVKWKKEEQRQRATDELSVPMMDRPSSTKSTRHKKQLLDVQDVDDEVEEAEKEQPLHILSQHAANPLLAAGEDDDDDVGSNESPSEVTSNDSSEDYSSEDDEEEDEQEEEVG